MSFTDVISDPLVLSRIQFAMTVSFHYLFPPLTIGLGLLLVAMEWRWLRTGDPVWDRASRFWTQIFAVNFALGVATGIVMEFEFGTNWAEYSRFVGDVFGSMLAAEGVWAFFLESGFLAVLVFGRDRVSPRFHFFSALMVCLGSIFSSVWIVMANSWMQTPDGFSIEPMLRGGEPWIVEGDLMTRAVMVDYFAAILNPSTANRLTHVWTGAMTMGAFLVLSISSYWILRRRHLEVATRSFTMALVLAALGTTGTLMTGDANARMVAMHQPAKLAAMEGVYETAPTLTPITAFGIPNDAEQKVELEVGMPGGLTALVYRRLHDEAGRPLNVPGLDLVAPDQRATTPMVYASFHIMVGCGSFLVGIVVLGMYFRARGTIWNQRWLLLLFAMGVVPAVLANQFGWFTAELGRQPWVVHPASPRVDPSLGVMSPLWVVNPEASPAEQVRQWTPGDDGADFAGWHYPYGRVIVRDAAGTTRLLADGAEPAEGETIVYDGTRSMRTSKGLSTAVRSGAILWACVMFLLIYGLLTALWIFVLNRKIHHGPDDDKPEGDESGLLGAVRDLVGGRRSMTGMRGGDA